MKKQTTLKIIAILLLLSSIVCVILCVNMLNGYEITYYRENLYNAADEIDSINKDIEDIKELERKYGIYKKDGIELLEKTKDVYFGIIDDSVEDINACYNKATIYGVLSGVLFVGFIILIIVYRKKFRNINVNSADCDSKDRYEGLQD